MHAALKRVAGFKIIIRSTKQHVWFNIAKKITYRIRFFCTIGGKGITVENNCSEVSSQCKAYVFKLNSLICWMAGLIQQNTNLEERVTAVTVLRQPGQSQRSVFLRWLTSVSLMSARISENKTTIKNIRPYYYFTSDIDTFWGVRTIFSHS